MQVCIWEFEFLRMKAHQILSSLEVELAMSADNKPVGCDSAVINGTAQMRASLFRPARKFSGFTLVELLVVIVIISILAALILPIGKRMMESSNASKCVSNLRQLYMAANRWSADNDGWMLPQAPGGRNADGVRINYGWPTALFPYLTPGLDVWKSSDVGKRPNGVFACPSSKKLNSPVNTIGFSDYSKNIIVNRVIPATNTANPSFKVGGMDNMSKIIFLADSPGTRDLSPYQSNGYIVNRHNGKANVLFYDGHVEALNSSDTNQIPLGESAAWSPPWQP